MSGILRRHSHSEADVGPEQPAAPAPAAGAPGAPGVSAVPGGNSPSASSGSELRRAVLEASTRVQEIIEVAEQAAQEIRVEAEREAEAVRSQARGEAERIVAARTDELKLRLGPLAQRLAGVQAEIQLLSAEVDTLAHRAPASASPPPPPPAAEPEPPREVAASEPLAANGSITGSQLDQALLRASQMAIAGSDRHEIERVLREDLGVAEPKPIVDRALGVD